MTDLDEFWNFLGSWFPDADLEGVCDDDKVVRNFVNTENHRTIEQVYLDLCEVLEMDTLPTAQIMKEANRHFEDDADCRAWLNRCFRVLAEHVTI